MALVRNYKKILLVFILLLSVAVARIVTLPSNAQNNTAQAKETITAYQASNYIGEVKTVCGKVASTDYASGSRGKPTFINLEKSYPNHMFTIVIWGENRHKFGNSPEKFYAGKEICVTGKITEYQGKPQIVVSGRGQIEINK